MYFGTLEEQKEKVKIRLQKRKDIIRQILTKMTCSYCNIKVYGNIDFQSYHYYIYHPERMREVVKGSFISNPEIRQKFKTLDCALENFIIEMEKFHAKESKYI